jgi:hypothetical protein
MTFKNLPKRYPKKSANRGERTNKRKSILYKKPKVKRKERNMRFGRYRIPMRKSGSSTCGFVIIKQIWFIMKMVKKISKKYFTKTNQTKTKNEKKRNLMKFEKYGRHGIPMLGDEWIKTLLLCDHLNKFGSK